MAEKPTCKKCSAKHWQFKPCESTEKNPESTKVETPTPKKASSGFGFPRSGSKFGFESGVPFSRTGDNTKFRKEGSQ